MSLSHFVTPSKFLKQTLFSGCLREKSDCITLQKQENSGQTLTEIWLAMSVEHPLF